MAMAMMNTKLTLSLIHISLLLLEDSSAAFAAYNSGEAVLIKDVPTDEIPSLTKAEDGGDFYVCLLYTSRCV